MLIVQQVSLTQKMLGKLTLSLIDWRNILVSTVVCLAIEIKSAQIQIVKVCC